MAFTAPDTVGSVTVGDGAAAVILRTVRAGVAGLGLVALTLAAGCGEDATPLDQTTTTAQLTPHLLPPSDQMAELARQQCRDDPQLAVGEVNAVDPERPDQKLATVQVDCAEVRAGRSGEISPAGTAPGDPAPAGSAPAETAPTDSGGA